MGTAPPVTTTTNPTGKKQIQTAPRTHQRVTRNNVPGSTIPIIRPEEAPRISPRLNPGIQSSPIGVATTPNCNRIPINSPNIISQEAVNFLTDHVWNALDEVWTPDQILEHSPTARWSATINQAVDIEHFCAAVVHPVTGETITQYKKLANDKNNPEFRKIWQVAFGKEIGRLAQGNEKTKTEGRNAMFIMNCAQIAKMHAEVRVPTNARIVVDFTAEGRSKQSMHYSWR